MFPFLGENSVHVSADDHLIAVGLPQILFQREKTVSSTKIASQHDVE